MKNKIAISGVILIVVICIVLSVGSIITAFILLRQPQVMTKDDNPGHSPPTLTETSQVLGITESDPNNYSIPPAIQLEMNLIQRQVIEGRGLQASGVFSQVLYTKEQFKQQLIEEFNEDYDPKKERESAVVLEVFGLLDPDFDLHGFDLKLLTEQVLGFYDNETKEMAVVLGDGFEGPERLTYAHEYTHALQDQNFDLRNRLNYNDDACEKDTERCAAIQALLEGDASLSEITWFQDHATIEDQKEIASFYFDLENPIFDSAPSFISKDLLFPYDYGYSFVEYLYQRGGWGEVNQAYNAPPVTTEQILHPEKYPNDLPVPVSLPDLQPDLGESWQEIDRNVMGEWFTYLILAHGIEEKSQLNETRAKDASEGWGGDAYSVYFNQDQDSCVMILKTEWESSSQADEFVNAFQKYANGRFGRPEEKTPNSITWDTSDGIHTLHFDGIFTTWIAAPDMQLANMIWNAIRD